VIAGALSARSRRMRRVRALPPTVRHDLPTP